ncbi:hypothetical protein VTO42DRAFT_4591 [Malbranchea cinnamomea]
MNSIATSQRKVLASKNDWDDWLSQTEGLARYWGCWQYVNPDLDEPYLNIYNTLVKRYEEETRKYTIRKTSLEKFNLYIYDTVSNEVLT